MVQVIDTDVLVIGGGGAAARAALEARRQGARVTMVMKGAFGKCGATAYKVAEIAGYNVADGLVDPADTPDEHFKDILAAAAGTCDERLARILATEAPLTLPDLEEWEVPLERDGDHYLEVVGCFASRPRMHIIRGHAEPILAALVPRLRDLGVVVVENTLITRLLTDAGSCVGAVGLAKDGEIVVFRAGATAMGTGGAGQLFLHNLNPPDVTGDGYALGYRAGAELVNMEFMQAGMGIVHPIKNILNQWVWMLHPRVFNARGEEFLGRYMPPGVTPEQCMDARSDHYPFSCYDGSQWLDVAIQKELLEGRGAPQGGVYVDFSETSEDTLPHTRRGDEIRKMWRITRQWLLEEKHLDVSKGPVQVACFGHAINGGMRIDENTSTTIDGLFASGEAAGGPHGADRLGGNMVLTCQVFGRRMGMAAAQKALASKTPWKADHAVSEEESRLKELGARRGTIKPLELKRRIQEAMWRGLLVVRSEEKLAQCLTDLAGIRADWDANLRVEDQRDVRQALEVDNMLLVGEIMVRAARLRGESRGSHFREDWQGRDDSEWSRSIVTRKVEDRMDQHAVRLPRLAIIK